MPDIKLWHGDCLELMKDIPDGSVDLVLTDPPYGTTKCRWDTVIPFEPMWTELKRIIKPNGAICLFGSEPFSSKLRNSNINMFRYDWIWDKVRPSGFQNAKYQPMKRHEIISVFGKKSPVYIRQMEKREKPVKGKVSKLSLSNPLTTLDNKVRTYTHKNPQSILVYNKSSDGKYLHPTQKPLALLEYLIKTYTLENETVLDFTMGSGSTGVACKNLNRDFIGIELDETYFKIAQERIADA